MSQLDISIAFSQLFGLLICFYLFLFYVSVLVHYYWYNLSLSVMSTNEISDQAPGLNMDSIVKSMLKY